MSMNLIYSLSVYLAQFVSGFGFVLILIGGVWGSPGRSAAHRQHNPIKYT